MQTQHENAQGFSAGRPKRVAWFVLLALATLQLAVAQHASAHAIEDVAETCAVCVQLDDNFNAPIAVAPTAVAPLDAALVGIPAGRIATGRSELAADSRGPPSI
jgi:hypothetical protein